MSIGSRDEWEIVVSGAWLCYVRWREMDVLRLLSAVPFTRRDEEREELASQDLELFEMTFGILSSHGLWKVGGGKIMRK